MLAVAVLVGCEMLGLQVFMFGGQWQFWWAGQFPSSSALPRQFWAFYEPISSPGNAGGPVVGIFM